MMLSITDHALRRFIEHNNGWNLNIPKHHQICLDLAMAKKLRTSVMTFLGVFAHAQKSVPPENYFMGKFLKHGVTDNRFFQLNGGLCYVIVHEPKVATIVTVAKSDPQKSKPWPIDTSIPNPYGAIYLKGIDSVGVPYDLKIGTEYAPLIKVLRTVNVPLKFGVRGKRSDHE